MKAFVCLLLSVLSLSAADFTISYQNPAEDAGSFFYDLDGISSDSLLVYGGTTGTTNFSSAAEVISVQFDPPGGSGSSLNFDVTNTVLSVVWNGADDWSVTWTGDTYPALVPEPSVLTMFVLGFGFLAVMCATGTIFKPLKKLPVFIGSND